MHSFDLIKCMVSIQSNACIRAPRPRRLGKQEKALVMRARLSLKLFPAPPFTKPLQFILPLTKSLYMNRVKYP